MSIKNIPTTGLIMQDQQDPAYANIATKSLLINLYNDILSTNQSDIDFNTVYKKRFIKIIQHGIDANIYNPHLLDFDFNELQNSIEPARDEKLEFVGLTTLQEAFLQPFELPQYFWMRIAMGLSLQEQSQTKTAINFYNTLSQLNYIPSTNILLNAGTINPHMASCYLTTTNNGLDTVFETLKNNAKIEKILCSYSNDWSNITTSDTTNHKQCEASQKQLSFLEIASTVAKTFRDKTSNQTASASLEVWHLDIESFLEFKPTNKPPQKNLPALHTSVWIPDLFMKRVQENGTWTLFSPHHAPELHHLLGQKFEAVYIGYERLAKQGKLSSYRTIQAKALWDKIVSTIIKTGYPSINFKDSCGLRSVHIDEEKVCTADPKGAVVLNTALNETANCNQGSINLSAHISNNGRLDSESIKNTVCTAIQMLDNSLDISNYLTKEAETYRSQYRSIGLGIMGLQDALYQMNIAFESEDAVTFSDELQEFISYYAILQSSKLAQERGAYPRYIHSAWKSGNFPIDTLETHEQERGVTIPIERTVRMNWDIVKDSVEEYGMRNAHCMAITSCDVLANILGVTTSIEPSKHIMNTTIYNDRKYVLFNKYFIQDLKTYGLWSQSILHQLNSSGGNLQSITGIPVELIEKYKDGSAIDPYWILKHAAYRGKWIDQSQTISLFPATNEVLSNIYIDAWTMGIKTTYTLIKPENILTIKTTNKYEPPVTNTFQLTTKDVIEQKQNNILKITIPGPQSDTN